MIGRSAILRSSRVASPLIRAWPDLLDITMGSRSSSPPVTPPLMVPARHFLDLHKMGSKEAIEKEKARLSDELSRGYFADISEIRKNGGKIAMASKTVTPSASAMEFPDLQVNLSDGAKLKLPMASDQNSIENTEKPNLVSLICLSFRASSQTMAESWSVPFVDAFSASEKVQVYEVSFVDSWFLSLLPIRKLFLKMTKKSTNTRRQLVYSFGDHYDLRKKLHIINLLTGYIFLLDRYGRIRWQGFGSATEEELSSLFSCTSLLLEEK